MAVDTIAKDTLGKRSVDGFAEVVPIVALERLASRVHVIGACFEDKANLIEWRGGGEVVHQTQVQRNIFGVSCRVGLSGRPGRFIDETGVSAGNDSRG